MTGGEALINHWHDRISHKAATGTAAGSPSEASSKQQRRPSKHADSSKFWTALLELVDVNAQVCGGSLPAHGACAPAEHLARPPPAMLSEILC